MRCEVLGVRCEVLELMNCFDFCFGDVDCVVMLMVMIMMIERISVMMIVMVNKWSCSW